MSGVADKLREARALIERGWCQGEAQIGDSYCVLGAIGAVQRISDGHCYFDMGDKLKSATNCSALARWNDAPERTQAEVLAAFDRAIELAEQSA